MVVWIWSMKLSWLWSLEPQQEARAQEEARNKAMAEENGTDNNNGIAFTGEEEDEEALVQRALEMSMQEMNSAAASQVETTESTDDKNSTGKNVEAAAEATNTSTTLNPVANVNAAALGGIDASFLNTLLGSVDQNDPYVQAAMAQLSQAQANLDSS